MTATTVTLLDFANDRSKVVLFWVGVGCPAGDYSPIGHPDLDFSGRNGLDELEGTIDADGRWQWNGEGSPTDGQRNTIYNLVAFEDAAKWDRIAEDYETEY